MNCAAVTITAADGDLPANGSSPSTSIPASPSSSGSPYRLDQCSCTCMNATTAGTSDYTAEGCSCTCATQSSPARMPKRAHMHKQLVHSSGPSLQIRRGVVAFEDRPVMLVTDTGNGCSSPHTTAELKYPDPGPDVVTGDGAYPLALPSPAAKCSTQMSIRDVEHAVYSGKTVGARSGPAIPW